MCLSTISAVVIFLWSGLHVKTPSSSQQGEERTILTCQLRKLGVGAGGWWGGGGLFNKVAGRREHRGLTTL